jgi:hypothetical protein
MIPRVAQLGTSFVGAGAYYLHDVRSDQDEPIRKSQQIAASDYYLHDKGAQSAKRVAYTETLNLPTRDAEKAMKVMAWTAAHASDIRQCAVAAAAKAAGIPYDQYVRLNNPFRGRKGSKSVYAYSLAWSPEQDAPSHREMAIAAKETLRVLGMEAHQAVLVVHNDKAHPHIHVIVNRVHPRTGLYADYSRDRLRLSAWAEAYERRTGRILCWERVENNRRRGNGEFVRHEAVSRADHEWWQKHKHHSPDAIRAARDLDQAQDRMELSKEVKRRETQVSNWAKTTLGPEIAQLKTEIARNEAILSTVKDRRRSKSVFRAVANALKRAAIKVFGCDKRAKGLLPRLKASLQTVEARKDAEVKKHAAWRQRAAALLAARHKLEKQRDEDRIRRLLNTRTAQGTTERARGAFNLRSHQETAQQFRRDVEAEKKRRANFDAAIDKRFYEQIRRHNVLDRLAKDLGGDAGKDASPGRKALAADEQTRPSRKDAKMRPREAFEGRVSDHLDKIERERKPRTRNRNRTRGRRRDR